METQSVKEFLQKGGEEINQMLNELNWEVRPNSIYYAIAEIFDIYRLKLKNRVRSLYASPRFFAVKAFVEKHKGKVENRRTLWAHKDAPYIQYYRCSFPSAIKPAEKTIVVYKDFEPNPNFAREALEMEQDVSGSYNAEAKLLWDVPEWVNIADLSFLDERQYGITVQILKSVCDNVRMNVWESIRFNRTIDETLALIDECFHLPVNIVGKTLKYPRHEYLKNIAVIERW